MDAPMPHRARVDRLLAHVEPGYQESCRAMLLGEAFTFAQAWQDWVVFWNHFADRLEWGDGVYVDIGTNQATHISNTLFFDKCLGWRGVCFEPQQEYHAAIRRQRSCTLVPHCVLGSAREAWFSGRETTGRAVPLPAHAQDGHGGRRVKCVAAEPVLRSLGLANGSRGVDLLSLDVEGAGWC